MQTKCAHCDLELTTDQKDGRFGTSPKERAERSKKLEEERTNLTKTLEAHPEAAELCYWRGRIQEALGRSDEAIVDYSRAVERDPLHGEARYRRTIADYWKLSANLDTAWELPSDFFERTQKDLEALDDFPTRRERAILLKGLLRFSRSLWEAGHDPTFWPASPVERFKAICQAFDEALADSLRENPTFFDALLLRGFFNALNRMNRSFDSSAYGRERETSAKRAATIEPNDSRCYEALASIHASMEDWGAALADTDEMVELCPGGLKGLLLRARLLWRMGLRPPALQAIDAAIQANPQSPDPYSVRASLRLSDWIQQRNESSCHDGAAPIERDLDAAVAREKRAGAARLVRAFARRAFFEDESGAGNDYQAWEGENRNHPWVRSGYFQKWKEERGSVGFLPEGLDLYPQADPERVRQGCVDHAKRLCDKPAADRAALLPTIAALVDRALELGEERPEDELGAVKEEPTVQSVLQKYASYSRLVYAIAFPESTSPERRAEICRALVANWQMRFEPAGLPTPMVATRNHKELVLQFPAIDRATFDKVREFIRLHDAKPVSLEFRIVASKELRSRWHEDPEHAVPPGYETIALSDDFPRDPEFPEGKLLVLRSPIATASDIQFAQAEDKRQWAGGKRSVPAVGSWDVSFQLTSEATTRFNEAAGELYRQEPHGQVAVLLEGRLLLIWTIYAERFGGSGVFPGLTKSQATDLADRLSSGPKIVEPLGERWVPQPK